MLIFLVWRDRRSYQLEADEPTPGADKVSNHYLTYLIFPLPFGSDD